MTATEWSRKRRILLAGMPVKWVGKDGRREITISEKDYGKEYSLRNLESGNTIEVTWNLDRISELLVD